MATIGSSRASTRLGPPRKSPRCSAPDADGTVVSAVRRFRFTSIHYASADFRPRSRATKFNSSAGPLHCWCVALLARMLVWLLQQLPSAVGSRESLDNDIGAGEDRVENTSSRCSAGALLCWCDTLLGRLLVWLLCQPLFTSSFVLSDLLLASLRAIPSHSHVPASATATILCCPPSLLCCSVCHCWFVCWCGLHPAPRRRPCALAPLPSARATTFARAPPTLPCPTRRAPPVALLVRSSFGACPLHAMDRLDGITPRPPPPLRIHGRRDR